MKKTLISIGIVFLCIAPCFASEWFEIFNKRYIDMSTIFYSKRVNVVTFWEKSLRQDPKEVELTTGKPYWYKMAKWNIDCGSKQANLSSLSVYDLNGEVLYSDTYNDWDDIVPDSVGEGYYGLFCLTPFEENPLLNNH